MLRKQQYCNDYNRNDCVAVMCSVRSNLLPKCTPPLVPVDRPQTSNSQVQRFMLCLAYLNEDVAVSEQLDGLAFKEGRGRG